MINFLTINEGKADLCPPFFIECSTGTPAFDIYPHEGG